MKLIFFDKEIELCGKLTHKHNWTSKHAYIKKGSKCVQSVFVKRARLLLSMGVYAPPAYKPEGIAGQPNVYFRHK